MDSLLWFGDGGAAGRRFDFEPENQVSLSDNFKDMVTATSRMPGVSGGFNAYRGGALPSAVGTVSVTFWMHFAGDNAEAQRRRDALTSMAGWGIQRLYKQTAGGDIRWCWAAVNNSPINFTARDVPHLQQRISVTFHVPDPFWYSLPYPPLRLDYGHRLDTGLTVPSGAQTFSISAPGVVEVEVRGSAPAQPVIRIEATGTSRTFLDQPGLVLDQVGLVLDGISSGSVEALRLQRVDRDSLAVTHDLMWTGLISGKDRLVIDTRKSRVIYEDEVRGNISGWDRLKRSRAEIFTLLPGRNRIAIDGVFTGSVVLSIGYWETWR